MHPKFGRCIRLVSEKFVQMFFDSGSLSPKRSSFSLKWAMRIGFYTLIHIHKCCVAVRVRIHVHSFEFQSDTNNYWKVIQKLVRLRLKLYLNTKFQWFLNTCFFWFGCQTYTRATKKINYFTKIQSQRDLAFWYVCIPHCCAVRSLDLMVKID